MHGRHCVKNQNLFTFISNQFQLLLSGVGGMIKGFLHVYIGKWGKDSQDLGHCFAKPWYLF